MDNLRENIKLSVVIVSYNCLEFLKQCINSIDKYNDIGNALEIIVVDNSPNDDIVEWLKINRTDIIAISNDNKGFGHGNNVGAKYAHGNILLFLNPDTIIIEPVFQYAINRFFGNSSLGMFGVSLIGSDQKPNSSYGLRMPLGMMRTVICNILIKLKIFVPQIMYTSGADIFIRKDVFFDAGSFDENIFMYCEEADLTNRVNKIGYKNKYYSEKKIIHLEGKTQVMNLSSSYIKVMNSRKYYCEKYNLNYMRFVNKEIFYCKVKSIVYKFKKNTEMNMQYREIVKFLENEKIKGIKKE